MNEHALDIGLDRFLQVRQAERARRTEQRRLHKADALAALHDAREAFRDHASVGYADGAGAADRDSDILEAMADRMAGWMAVLERDLESLGPARDQTVRRGPVLIRSRPAFDAGLLAEAVAQSLIDVVLGEEAGAVLVAAVRYAGR